MCKVLCSNKNPTFKKEETPPSSENFSFEYLAKSTLFQKKNAIAFFYPLILQQIVFDPKNMTHFFVLQYFVEQKWYRNVSGIAK